MILLVEDNEFILDANQQILTHDGYRVLTAGDLGQARKLLKAASPDVVVLDVTLPDGDGVDFLPELRRYTTAPVLFLTAKDKPGDRLAGLRAGGNDYITKPYDIEEFRIRVRNFISLQIENKKTADVFTLGPIRLDILAQQAFVNGEDLLLSPKELALLLLFAQHPGLIIDGAYLYGKIWGQQMNDDFSALKNTMSRLRKKLSGSGYTITSERGEGYYLERE